MDHFVHYREVALLEAEMYCHYMHVGQCIGKCLLYGGNVLYHKFHRGIYTYICMHVKVTYYVDNWTFGNLTAAVEMVRVAMSSST